MVMAESVTKSVVRLQAAPVNIKALLKMAVTESVIEPVFGKASGLY